MKERPILMSAPMVRATLDDSKTQTRRITDLEYFSRNDPDNWRCVRIADGVAYFVYKNSPQEHSVKCRYGKPGDRLWVRETCLGWWNTADGSFSHAAAYKADGYELEPGERWIPSIHMPRKASRITLEITGVRVERLQGISEKDVLAEGIRKASSHYDYGSFEKFPFIFQDSEVHSYRTDSAICAYKILWESINGPESWDVNPWVWVIEFQRVIA